MTNWAFKLNDGEFYSVNLPHACAIVMHPKPRATGIIFTNIHDSDRQSPIAFIDPRQSRIALCHKQHEKSTASIIYVFRIYIVLLLYDVGIYYANVITYMK